MKLTQEHVGKRVYRVGKEPAAGIVAQTGNSALFLENDPRRYMQDDDTTGTWELVPETLTAPTTLSLLEIVQQDGGTQREFQFVGGVDRDGNECRNFHIQHGQVVCSLGVAQVADQELLEARYTWVEEKKVEVTPKSLQRAYEAAFGATDGPIEDRSAFQKLKKALGL